MMIIMTIFRCCCCFYIKNNQYLVKTVIGSMVYFHMQHHVQDIGIVGMVRQPYNNVHSHYFIMMLYMLVIGQIMYPIVKNIVSIVFLFNFHFHFFVCCLIPLYIFLLCWLKTTKKKKNVAVCPLSIVVVLWWMSVGRSVSFHILQERKNQFKKINRFFFSSFDDGLSFFLVVVVVVDFFFLYAWKLDTIHHLICFCFCLTIFLVFFHHN